MNNKHYFLLLVMTVLHFLAMFTLMYAMVDAFSNVYGNLNQFYMAALMTSPMLIIELSLMRTMYHHKKWNALIYAAAGLALIVSFASIRRQVAISDEQFLRSMIPHHAGAILMCENASIQDDEIKQLCKNIISSQQREIDQMKAKLHQLEK